MKTGFLLSKDEGQTFLTLRDLLISLMCQVVLPSENIPNDERNASKNLYFETLMFKRRRRALRDTSISPFSDTAFADAFGNEKK